MDEEKAFDKIQHSLTFEFFFNLEQEDNSYKKNFIILLGEEVFRLYQSHLEVEMC